MIKSEINAEIARYFGFREAPEYPVDGKPQWSYPDAWYLKQGVVPNTAIPDFVQMLEDYLSLMAKHSYGGPRERFMECE